MDIHYLEHDAICPNKRHNMHQCDIRLKTDDIGSLGRSIILHQYLRRREDRCNLTAGCTSRISGRTSASGHELAHTLRQIARLLHLMVVERPLEVDSL